MICPDSGILEKVNRQYFEFLNHTGLNHKVQNAQETPMTEQTAKPYKAWDLPTRLFHWINFLCVIVLSMLGLIMLNKAFDRHQRRRGQRWSENTACAGGLCIRGQPAGTDCLGICRQWARPLVQPVAGQKLQAANSRLQRIHQIRSAARPLSGITRKEGFLSWLFC